MNQILKKYVLCLIFSVDLFVLVWLSEMLRNVVLAISTGLNSGLPLLIAYGLGIFSLFVFGIVPSVLLVLWLINPLIIKKLLVQFGLTEDISEDKEKRKEVRQKPEKQEETEQEKLKREFQKRST